MNQMENHFLRRANLADYIKRGAQIFPNETALVDGDEELNYSEFSAKVNAAANALLKIGIKKGDRIAIISHACIDFMILWFGAMKIGAIINPINFALKGAEIEFIVNHAKPEILVAEDALTLEVDSVKGNLTSVRDYFFIKLTDASVSDDWKSIKELTASNESVKEPLVEIGDYDPATLIYTSGTESRPKGVLGSHLSLYFSTMHLVSDLGISKNHSLLLVAPLHHIAGMLLTATSFYNGAKVVVNKFPEPKNIFELTKKHQIGLWTFPPATLSQLADVPEFSKDIVASVTMLLAFGSALPKAIAEKWKKILPDVTMVNYYGQTESGPLGTCSSGEDIIAHPGSIGKPHRLVEIKIFDENDQEVPVGHVGEIVMRGPTIMLGYYNDTEKTKKALQNGWLHTGDFAYVDESGFFHFVDRKKDIIVTGSENVSSLEVEQQLLFHPQINDAAVIGLPHEKWGEAVTAVVQTTQDSEIKDEDIIQFCKERMAGYKVPKIVLKVEAIPRSATGKALKSQLRSRFTS